ncbi:hypothetical protein JW879_08850 [candidate division WOR-3 bacterium]|nr:hypothetical protein [candidate division WOR-3 bacterium]
MRKLFIIIAIILFCFSCESINDDLQNYLDLLTEYSSYDYEEVNNIEFIYMDSSDENLRALKEEYNLETIAGEGDELSRIMNLMLWVNENLEHDGSSENPYPPNASNIIETCWNEDRGVNCRMLSIVLNDFYLSMGFKSRFVTCEPYEYDFDDCHVINIVYSTQFDKWIMVDPSFAGYFKDENDTFLDLFEVREKLIDDEVLVFSSHLNHNGGIYTEQAYRAYLAKNLFRFSCPIESAFNYEAQPYSSLEYIELIPLNYSSPGQGRYIYTRNPDIFWAEP